MQDTPPNVAATPVLAFKGFDIQLQCHDFQYEIGGSYEHTGKVEACSEGFHACEYPLDVFGYYAPSDSRFATVELSGELSRESSDSKIAAARISIKAELKIPELVSRAVNYILSRIQTSNTEAATGDWSAATNTGDQSAATNTGYRSAATNTGDWSAATNTGYQSAASVEGKHAVAASLGIQGKAKASVGGAIVLCYRDIDAGGEDYGRILHIRAGIAGQEGVKPDTWYSLSDSGEFVEVA